jgi:hypothetical protein
MKPAWGQKLPCPPHEESAYLSCSYHRRSKPALSSTTHADQPACLPLHHAPRFIRPSMLRPRTRPRALCVTVTQAASSSAACRCEHGNIQAMQ